MKTRRRTKGGQPVKNMPKSIRFQRNVHDKDCGASVVKFLGYATEKDSDYLARQTPNGIRIPVMMRLLWRAYGNKGFRFQHVTNMEEDLLDLRENEYTIGCWFSSETAGHYFVVHRKRTSKWAIDPQTNEIIPLNRYLNTDFKRATFQICLIDDDQTSIDHGDSRITKEIIDEVLEQSDLAAEASESRQVAEQAED